MSVPLPLFFSRNGRTAFAFAAGLACGVLVLPGVARQEFTQPAKAEKPPADFGAPVIRGGHPAEVLRVIDGDTFEARVRVWPGTEITTKVRLRGVDAPEMHARCDDERVKAEASREALIHMLAQGNVTVMQISLDKYGGRVVADVSSRGTPDVSSALISAGQGRRYSGGRRESWCG